MGSSFNPSGEATAIGAITGLGSGVATELARPLFATTATAAGTTTLTVTSATTQEFTGTTTQAVNMPVTTTLTNGWAVTVVNKSTEEITVGAVSIYLAIKQGESATFVCNDASFNAATSWTILNNFRPDYAATETTSSPSTTELFKYSAFIQRFYGGNPWTAKLPSTQSNPPLPIGWKTTILNTGTGSALAVVTAADATVVYLYPGQSATFISNTQGSDAVWAWDVVGLSPLEFTATLASAQTVADGTEETLVFQGAVGSLASALNPATGVFTATKAGTVLLSGMVQAYVINTSSYNFYGNAYYRKNGASPTDLGYFTAVIPGNGTNNGGTTIPFALPVTVAAGDTLEVSVTLSDEASGGTLTAEANTSWTVKYITP